MTIRMDLSLKKQTFMDTEDSISRPLHASNERRNDLARLATFLNWPQNARAKLSKGLLARQGFSYMGENDRLRCDGCRVEIDSWTSDMDPLEEHHKRSPQCPFVSRQRLLNSHTDETCSQSAESNPSESLPFAVDEATFSAVKTSSGSEIEQDPNMSDQRRRFLLSVPSQLLDQLRAKTFSNWPLITPNTQDMVRGGWYYTNIGDRVLCLHCHVMFHKWTNTDRPFEMHEQISPSCPFVQLSKRQLIDPSKSRIEITTEPTTRVKPEPINTAYAEATRRYETFQNWPDKTHATSPSAETFVDAGFFYTGKQNIVRCFFCHGALRNWQARDDPKIEHARWYPQCAYIRQLTGEDLYEAVQRKNRQLKAQQDPQGIKNYGTVQISPWTENDIDRMVKARLNLPGVGKLLDFGYSMSILRKCLDMQLRFKKDDFKTDADLQIAYFVLEKQVKMINGNVENILIPSKWTKPTRDQSKADAPVSSIVEAPAKDPSPEKTIEPMQTELKTTVSQSNACLICLTNERQIAFLPCGHLSSCVTCGHSLKTCPLCRTAVKGFIRIYV